MVIDDDALHVNEADFEPSDAVTHGDLLDVTSNTSPSNSSLQSTKGWYISLEHNGEKVSGDPAIFQGRIFFTTYLPSSTRSNDCVPVQGSGRLYTVSLGDGSPASDTLNQGDVSPSDRYIDIPISGPGGGVNLGVFRGETPPGPPPPEDQDPCGDAGDLAVIIGTSVYSGGKIKGCGLNKTRWFESDAEHAQELIDAEVNPAQD